MKPTFLLAFTIAPFLAGLAEAEVNKNGAMYAGYQQFETRAYAYDQDQYAEDYEGEDDDGYMEVAFVPAHLVKAPPTSVKGASVGHGILHHHPVIPGVVAHKVSTPKMAAAKPKMTAAKPKVAAAKPKMVAAQPKMAAAKPKMYARSYELDDDEYEDEGDDEYGMYVAAAIPKKAPAPVMGTTVKMAPPPVMGTTVKMAPAANIPMKTVVLKHPALTKPLTVTIPKILIKSAPARNVVSVKQRRAQLERRREELGAEEAE
ncbi:hypothetical protein HK104_000351, partial [Borealophlyctis nickersoniae]